MCYLIEGKPSSVLEAVPLVHKTHTSQVFLNLPIMSSTPAAAPNPATVQALRIFDFELDKNNPNPAKGQFVKVDPKTERFLILAASASMALDLLHSRAGYRALQTCAKVTIEDTAKEHRAGRLVENSGEYTQEFLASVRKNFPVLVIRNLDAMNGRSTKHDWHDANPKHYVPASAGIVEVNRLVSSLLP